jgi:hypothetical protein
MGGYNMKKAYEVTEDEWERMVLSVRDAQKQLRKMELMLALKDPSYNDKREELSRGI